MSAAPRKNGDTMGKRPLRFPANHSTNGVPILSSQKPQTSLIRSDKRFVSRFVENAVQILEAAESAVESGHTPSDVTILIGPEGSLRMVADSDWPLDSLQLFYGSNMAYRVSQRASMVRVEGRAGSRTCLFETPKPERAARLLLNRLPLRPEFSQASGSLLIEGVGSSRRSAIRGIHYAACGV